MGLFGGIFKAVGKVAQAGLSVATHGASDKILKVLKGRGADKAVLAKGPAYPPTKNELATVRKMFPAQNMMSDAALNGALNAVGRKYQRANTGVEGYKATHSASGRKRAYKRKPVAVDAGYFPLAGEPVHRAPKRKKATDLGVGAGYNPYPPPKRKGFNKDGSPRKPPSPAQPAQRARFAAMVKARRGA